MFKICQINLYLSFLKEKNLHHYPFNVISSLGSYRVSRFLLVFFSNRLRCELLNFPSFLLMIKIFFNLFFFLVSIFKPLEKTVKTMTPCILHNFCLHTSDPDSSLANLDNSSFCWVQFEVSSFTLASRSWFTLLSSCKTQTYRGKLLLESWEKSHEH